MNQYNYSSMFQELLFNPALNMNFHRWNLFWSICFASVAVVTIVGNCLSISVLLRRRLRKRPHYLLVELALADLLVGIFAIPILMITSISQERVLSQFVSDCVDMFTGLWSVFTLALISIERLYAISHPLHHRQLSLKSYIIAMVMPWVFSIIVTSTRVLLYFGIMTTQHFVAVIIVSLSTPLLTSFISYGIIGNLQASRPLNDLRPRSNSKLAYVLLLITGTFVLTWLPFQILVIVFNICISCRGIPGVIVYVIKLLQFSNSFINFIIYCLRMPNYRKIVLEIIVRLKCSLTGKRELKPTIFKQSNISLISFTSTLTLHNMKNT
ncbi:adenosine receptor A1-like [Stylophora pistillata]|uniref:adenosine receptor A1-like n=1 Tax=Stylophora pistillata TaxID=50429 RepID=UPI000C03B167|nr:adenosine receptor A1-like [Stylophora pistillata]